MQTIIETGSVAETIQLAEDIGRRLRGGEVIELRSDLGGGKTTFVRGLAAGFGSDDRVASPTFTVSKVYQAGSKQLVHLDFYRLNDPGIVAHELADYAGAKDTVVAVEWADIVKDALPAERLTIEILPTGDESRQLVMTYTDSLAYLLGDNR